MLELDTDLNPLASCLAGLYFGAYDKHGEYMKIQGKVLYRISDSVYYLCLVKVQGEGVNQLRLYPLAVMQYFKFQLPEDTKEVSREEG